MVYPPTFPGPWGLAAARDPGVLGLWRGHVLWLRKNITEFTLQIWNLLPWIDGRFYHDFTMILPWFYHDFTMLFNVQITFWDSDHQKYTKHWDFTVEHRDFTPLFTRLQDTGHRTRQKRWVKYHRPIWMGINMDYLFFEQYRFGDLRAITSISRRVFPKREPVELYITRSKKVALCWL